MLFWQSMLSSWKDCLFDGWEIDLLLLTQTLPSIQDISFYSNHFFTFWSIQPTLFLFSWFLIMIVPPSVTIIISPPSVTAKSLIFYRFYSMKRMMDEKLVTMILFLLVRRTISQELLRTSLMYSCSSSSWAMFIVSVLRSFIEL